MAGAINTGRALKAPGPRAFRDFDSLNAQQLAHLFGQAHPFAFFEELNFVALYVCALGFALPASGQRE